MHIYIYIHTHANHLDMCTSAYMQWIAKVEVNPDLLPNSCQNQNLHLQGPLLVIDKIVELFDCSSGALGLRASAFRFSALPKQPLKPQE